MRYGADYPNFGYDTKNNRKSAPNTPYATCVEWTSWWNGHLVWNGHLARFPTPDSRLPTPDPPTLTLVRSSRMTDEAGKSYREGKARAIFLPD
ncbi:hypothetical protein [Moorena sp. SIO3A2]|uniref:hypothetical protein n=1 Tax=Moorena sp. SIO3A2 TaxID=2607841 RepID=UPI0013B893A7|nr:hypothetical protein [Moorena sp. SIO3A2]NER90718.1 hypothetical protein [Moorena sp. SIO3A2]